MTHPRWHRTTALSLLGTISLAAVIAAQQRGGRSETYQQQMAREQAEHPTLSLGAHAPDFSLKGIDGKRHTLAEYRSFPVLMVVFVSNHCPASEMYENRIKQIVRDYEPKGVKVIAIAPNGPKAVAPRELNYADLDDSFDSMVKRASFRQFNFPYLYDGDTQKVAHSFGPKVTPHVFIFDKTRTLRFEGRIDDSLREERAKTHETRDALDALVAGQPVPVAHTAVFGCSTKWNSQVDGKKAEMDEWMAQPVNLEPVTAEGLKALRKNPTGKTLMINFWATWCGPCVVEYPQLLTAYLWYRSRDFEFISVSVDEPAAKPAVQKFLDQQHSAVRNLQFASDDVYAMMAAFDKSWESGVPFTIILAPDGKEIYRREGEADVLKLKRTILAHLPSSGPWVGNTEYWQK